MCANYAKRPGMKTSLAELSFERGRLIERIAHQRSTLARQLQPLQDAQATGYRLLARCRLGVDYLSARPGLLALGLLAVVLVKPRRALAWGLRGAVLWRSWRRLRASIPPELWALATRWFRL